LIEADVKKKSPTPKEGWGISAIKPEDAPHAAHGYLDVLNDAVFGAATMVEPRFTSHSAPSNQ